MSVVVNWTPELCEQLKDLWEKGYSCSQIAAMIPGTTRSSVIGKVHRLGLSGRRTVERKPSKEIRAVPPSLKTNKVSIPKLVDPKPPRPEIPALTTEQQRAQALPYSGLEDRMCHWPLFYAEDGTQMYCAGAAEPRKSYCKCHQVMSAPPKGQGHGEYKRAKPSSFRYR